MKLILKELDNLKCTAYVKDRLKNLLYFSDRITRDVDFSQGKFYTMVPEEVNPEYPDPDYYEFRWGGIIFPFERPEGGTWVGHINYSEDIIWASSFEYIQSDRSNAICLENFIDRPEDPCIKRSTNKYYLINNGLFYLIDNRLAPEEINSDFGSAIGFGFMCLILKLQEGLDALHVIPGEELPDTAKEDIFKSIDSFYFDVYDDESYLIWVKDPGKSEFFHILSRKIYEE